MAASKLCFAANLLYILHAIITHTNFIESSQATLHIAGPFTTIQNDNMVEKYCIQCI